MVKIEIDPNRKITKNAAKYYEKGKKYKGKIEGAKKAIKETKKLIKKAKKAEKTKKEKLKKIKKNREWYSKFHWFKTTNDFLVVAGKNADQNEEIVKNYMEEEDLYFHADVHGAPSTVIKKGKKAKKTDLEETSVFAGSYSSAWKQGVGTTDVYHVEPSQVKLGAESGEHMGKGSFMIKGKKNYYRNTELKIAFTIEGNEIKVAPLETFEKKGISKQKLVLLRPGETEKNKASKQIKKKLIEKFNVKIDLNWILERMPPNGCIVR